MTPATGKDGTEGVPDANHGLTVLRAGRADSLDLWQWRNDQTTRQMSTSPEVVEWDAHSIWFERTLANADRFLFMGCMHGTEKVGMCRFDLDVEANVAEVSINLNPAYRGKGLSSPLLRAAMAMFLEQRTVDLSAKIRKGNIGSIKCFTGSGFVLEREDGEYNFYRRRCRPSGSKGIDPGAG